MKSQKILFVCTHNSVRSIIAEALLRNEYPDHYQVASGGTKPSFVNPFTIQVLEELGINIENLRSKSVNIFMKDNIDLVITVCDSAKEKCPIIPNARQVIHKRFQDPSVLSGTVEEILNNFRTVREEIKNWIEDNFKPE